MSRILMLTHEFPPFPGGVGTYSKELALAAGRIGHKVTVYAPAFDTDASDELVDDLCVRRFPGGAYTKRRLPSLLKRVHRTAMSGEYDIVHAIDWAHATALEFVNRFRKVPFIASTFGSELLGLSGSAHVRLLAGGRLFNSATRIAAISQFTQQLLLDRCPYIHPEQVTVTPLGVDESRFSRATRQIDIRDRFGIAPDHTILLTVARLDERKGHRTTMRALGQLPDDVKRSVTYLIVGICQDEQYRRELESLAASTDVPVIFAGPVDDDLLHSCYCQSDVFCMPGEPHPTRVEGFGLVYLEAAAQRLPSIGSYLGAVPEVVLNEQTGLLIEPSNVCECAGAITRLLRDQTLRSTLGNNAYEYARGFTWERCAQLTYGSGVTHHSAESPSLESLIA